MDAENGQCKISIINYFDNHSDLKQKSHNHIRIVLCCILSEVLTHDASNFMSAKHLTVCLRLLPIPPPVYPVPFFSRPCTF